MSHVRLCGAAFAFLSGALVLSPLSAVAQGGASPRPEVRFDAIVARYATLQAGVGVNAAAGAYLRWGVVAGAGASRQNGRDVATARVDGVVRFLLDPFRESRRAPYGIAGVSLMDDGSHDWEPRALIGLGLEGSSRGRVIPSIELALGGGVRVSAVVRRGRANRR